jgi:hypothetical protein
MSELAILQELELPLFALRENIAPQPEKIATPELKTSLLPQPFVVCVSENTADFNETHREQLNKILSFLGYNANEYLLVFADQTFNEPCDIVLSFGSARKCTSKQHITTHSLSMMLQNPACKREVLHAIQSLKKA